jgi:hypothetical protein
LWARARLALKIRGAITDDAVVFLACFSRNSLAREVSYQNEELVLVIDQPRMRRPAQPWLMPVRLDDVDVPDLDMGGGRTLASIQRADVFGGDSGAGAARLVEAVLQIFQSNAAAAV